MSAALARQVGDRIPGRIARVAEIRLEERHGRPFVAYLLSDSLRGPKRRPVGAISRQRRKLRLIDGGNEL